MRHQSVYAIAVSEKQALHIEDQLSQVGFSSEEISALIPDQEYAREFAPAVHARPSGGIFTGTATGGVFGEALGLLASIGAFAIPGIGRLIGVGPLVAALSGVAGAAVVGMSGALAGLGVPLDTAKHYEDRIAAGDILLSIKVETAEEVKRAKEVLNTALAEDIAVTSAFEGDLA